MSTSECYVYLCNGHTYNVLPASSQGGSPNYSVTILIMVLTAGSNAKLPLMMLMFVCVMGKIHSFRVRIDCNVLTFEKMYS